MKTENMNMTNKPAGRMLWPGSKAVLLAACVGIGALGQLAQGQAVQSTGITTNWTHAYDYGSDWAGAYGSFEVFAKNERLLEPVFNANEPGFSRTEVSAEVGLKFLQQRIRAASLILDAHNDSGACRFDPTNVVILVPMLVTTPYFHIALVATNVPVNIPRQYCYRSFTVGGYSVDCGQTTASYSAYRNFSTTFWSGSADYSIGPVPITVGGSVGAGASMSYALQVPTNGASIYANPGIWISASAYAGVGGWGCGVGPYFDLELGRTSFRPSVSVTPTTISAQANLTFNPVRIEMDLAAFLFGAEVGSVTLASYSAAASTVPLVPSFYYLNNTCSH
jgi:hypothetical protein